MKKVFIGAILSLFVVGFANADVLDFTGLNLGTHLTIDLTYNNVDYHVAAGKLDFKDVTTGQDLVTVCADLTENLGGGNQNYGVSLAPPDNQFPGGDKAAQIVANEFNLATTWQQQAGLQLAVWDALYNNNTSFDLTNASSPLSITNWDGTSIADQNSINAYAQQYYAGYNMGGQCLFFNATTPGSNTVNGGQSQFAPVPEPASFGALAVGLIGLVVRRRAK